MVIKAGLPFKMIGPRFADTGGRHRTRQIEGGVVGQIDTCHQLAQQLSNRLGSVGSIIGAWEWVSIKAAGQKKFRVFGEALST